MRRPSLKRSVYRVLCPFQRSCDPPDFDSYIRAHIIPEVREETQRYYGPYTSTESMYPGLDYTDKGHRLRLSQFKYHCRLFQAFEVLGLSKFDIDELCTWAGTKAARDNYMARNNVVIRDTTFDAISSPEPQRPPTVTQHVFPYISSGPSGRGGYLPSPRVAHHLSHYYSQSPHGSSSPLSSESEQESSDDIVSRSIGISLNRRLVAASERRYRGNTSANMDPAWEAWMKDATDRGTIPSVSALGGSASRLAAYQAHIPAHWPYATPVYHYGPYSPAPSTYSPTYVNSYGQQQLAPVSPLQPVRPFQFNSFAARQSRRHFGHSPR